MFYGTSILTQKWIIVNNNNYYDNYDIVGILWDLFSWQKLGQPGTY